MADFPISPYLAKVLLSSITYKCSKEMIIIVSMLSVEDVYISPRGQKKQEEAHKAHAYFHHVSGDHMTMLNIYKQWESSSYGNYSKEWCKKYFLHYRALVMAKNIKNQLELIFQRLNLPILSCQYHKDNNSNEKSHKHNHKHRHHHSKTEEIEEDIYDTTMKDYDYTLILKAVCQAYYMNVAKRFTNRPYFYNYKQSTSDTLLKMFNKDQHQELVPLFIHPSSSIHSSSHSQDAHYLEWVVYHHTIFTNRCYIRHVSIIHFEWVKDLLENVDKIDYSKLFEKDVHDIVSIEAASRNEINSSDSDSEETLKEEEEEIVSNKKRKSSREIKRNDEIKKSKQEEPNNKTTDDDENYLEKEKSESVEDSRKAALERYLERKKLKEKKKK